MKSQYLSFDERRKGVKYFLLSTMCNGLGISFLATTIVQLLAINFGANNYQIGFINSLMQLSGILLIFIPILIKGRNIAKVYSLFWFLRGLFILLNLTTLFLPDDQALMMIIFSYTLFCISRMIAFSTFDPIRRMLSTSYNRGEIVLQTDLRFNLTRLLGSIISFIIVTIPFFSGLLGLLSIQLVGIVMNSLAAFFILKIPCREKAEKAGGLSIFKLLLKSLKNKQKWIPLIQNWIMQTHFVLFGFVIALLKKIFLFSESLVLFFSIVIAVGMILAVYLTRPFIDKLSSRPIIFIISIFQGILFLIWIFIKSTTPLIFIFFLGFFSTFTRGIIQPYVGKNIIRTMPDHDKINFNSMNNFFSAIFVFSIGGMLAGFLGDQGEGPLSFAGAGVNAYYLIFILSAVLAFINAIVSLFLKDKEGFSIRQTIKLFFSFKNLRAFRACYYLSMTSNREKRFKYINLLKKSDSPYAMDEMRKLLYNPLTPETQDILTSLFYVPRPKLLQDIINIADDHHSYRRDRAIFTLGAYPDPLVESKLIQYMNEEDPLIQSTAAKSLARIGNKDYFDDISNILKSKNYSTLITMNYLIALGTMDDDGVYLKDLFKICGKTKNSSRKQALYSLVSRQLKMQPPLNLIYQRENLNSGEGVKFLLEESRQFRPFNDAFKSLSDNYSKREYQKLAKWCSHLLKEYDCKNQQYYLKKALISYPHEEADKDDALITLYFTFQVLSASHYKNK